MGGFDVLLERRSKYAKQAHKAAIKASTWLNTTFTKDHYVTDQRRLQEVIARIDQVTHLGQIFLHGGKSPA